MANAQKYDTIKVGISTAVHLIFESPLRKAHIGLGEQIDASGNRVKDIYTEIDSIDNQRLSLTAAIEMFETTNLFVETEEGYYNFILKYSTWPPNQLIPIFNSQATIQKKKGLLEKKSKDITMKDPSSGNDTINQWTETILRKRSVDPTIGEINQKMQVYLNGIYVNEKYIFFRVTMKNNGNISFELGNEFFQVVEIESKGTRVKRAKETDEQKETTFIKNNDQNKIDGKKEVSKVYVFKKFTVDTRKRFVIDLWEKSPGQRKFQLKIPAKELLKAELI